jgi:predicted methyltransferase
MFRPRHKGGFIMSKRSLFLAFALSVALPLAAASAAPSRAPADTAAAVAAPGRPAEAVALDEGRRPAEVLSFAGLRRGDRALDLFTGSGYFAELMGRAVGPTGSALAWEPANFMNDRTRAALAALRERTPNVSVMVAPADALALPAAAFDFAMINLNYHDTYWQSDRFRFPRMDPDAFLRTVFQSLKPGGTIAVIDHVANPGGDTRAVVEALHRIDPATIRADFERAGFVFDGESNILRNPADDHTKLVFDPAIRGRTDRVVYRFRRPAR